MSDSFCLDLNEKYTRICDANIKKDKIELVSLGFEETVPNFFTVENEKNIEKQAEIISTLYAQLRLKKKAVNVIIPDGFTYSQIIEMPKLKEKELLSAIRYQADEFIPMPIEETTLDLEILKEDAKEKKLLILIVAAPKKIVKQIGKTLDIAGLTPNNLENELSATGRLYTEFIAKQKNNSASVILNLGYNNSSLYLFDKSKSLVTLSRTFKIGIDLLIKDIVVNFNIDNKKALDVLKMIGFAKNENYNLENILMSLLKELLSEIDKFISLIKDKFNLPIDSIILFNFSAYINQMSEVIEAHTKIKTSQLALNNVLVQNTVSQTFQADMPSFVSVVSGNIQ